MKFSVPQLRICGMLITACAFVAAATAAIAGKIGTELSQQDIRVGGILRNYVIYSPPNPGHDSMPLVLVLHGQGGSGAQVIEQGHWKEVAQRNRFVLVAPNGVLQRPDGQESFFGNKRSWNAGPGSDSFAEQHQIDDVGFIRALLDQVETQLPIDKSRVYVTGFSNGAAMAFRVAAELSDRFSAVAPVSNALLVPARLDHPVSLLLIWGSDDPLNPFAGGEIKRRNVSIRRPSANQSLMMWSRSMHCGDRLVSKVIADGVTRSKVSDCPIGSDAELIVVAGLGHQWPGGRAYLTIIAGSGSNKLDATTVIWNFFEAHNSRLRTHYFR